VIRVTRRSESEGEETMSEFEVRARLKVREGRLDEFKRQAAEMMRQTREKDTRTLAYDWFLSKDVTQCEVREAYADPDGFVEHAFNVRQARDALFGGSAHDHKIVFYGDPSPRVIELVDKIGVDVTYFTLLQALEPASVH
jgi:quinol monooxygenase YgiN